MNGIFDKEKERRKQRKEQRKERNKENKLSKTKRREM
jgi:hypothetical protein